MNFGENKYRDLFFKYLLIQSEDSKLACNEFKHKLIYICVAQSFNLQY